MTIGRLKDAVFIFLGLSLFTIATTLRAQTVTLTFSNDFSNTAWNGAVSTNTTVQGNKTFSVTIPNGATGITGQAYGGGGGGGGTSTADGHAGGGGGGGYISYNFGAGSGAISGQVGGGGERGEAGGAAKDGGDGSTGGESNAVFGGVTIRAYGGGGAGGRGVLGGGSAGSGGTTSQNAGSTYSNGDAGGGAGNGNGGAGGKNNGPGGGAGGAADTNGTVNSNPGRNGNTPGGGGASGGRTYEPGGHGAGGRVVVSFSLPTPTLSFTTNPCPGDNMYITVQNPLAGVTYYLKKDGTTIATLTSSSPSYHISSVSSSHNGSYRADAVYTILYSSTVNTITFSSSQVSADVSGGKTLTMPGAAQTLTCRTRTATPSARWGGFENVCPIDEGEASYSSADSLNIATPWNPGGVYFANHIVWDSLVVANNGADIPLSYIKWYAASAVTEIADNVWRVTGASFRQGGDANLQGMNHFWQNTYHAPETYYATITVPGECESYPQQYTVSISDVQLDWEPVIRSCYTKQSGSILWSDFADISVEPLYQTIDWYSSYADADAGTGALGYTPSRTLTTPTYSNDGNAANDTVTYWAVRTENISGCSTKPIQVSLIVYPHPAATLRAENGLLADTICSGNSNSLQVHFAAGTAPFTVEMDGFSPETHAVDYTVAVSPTLPTTSATYYFEKITDYWATLPHFVPDEDNDWAYSDTVTVCVFGLPWVNVISSPAPTLDGTAIVLPNQPSFISNSGAEYSSGWLLDGQEITASYQVTAADNGKTLCYFVTNACGTTCSNNLTLEVAYTVKFESNGGNALPDQIVVTGGLVAEPEPPAYYCYPFEGWYSDASCTVAWNFASCVITMDTTLYAKYGAVQTHDLYRWTGAADDQDWNNPNNWKKVVGGIEYSALYAPTPCVDVEIPGGLTNYPKPAEAGAAGTIYVKDRGMVANTHYLTYDSATVEVNFTVTERNRWVMYSAPLRKTYTGDFMLRDAMEIPMNGASNSAHPGAPAVYMSFFQTAYPDNPAYAATAKAFTQPFGTTDILLPLGKSFNIWIDADVDTGTAFRFPSPHTKYSYWVHYPWGGEGTPEESGELIRTDGANNTAGNRINGRFIVEDAASTDPATGEFTITPPDDASGYEYIMVPNPFMAYLDMAAFLTANTAALQNHYKIWDGQNGTFISYQPIPLYRPGLPYFGGTWWIASSPTAWDAPSGTAQYVSPLQSFIVEKKTPASIASLVYNPTTMTSAVYSPSTPYTLRNVKEEIEPEGILYITVSQNQTKNSTALVNAPDASNSYTDEDVRKLCFDNEEGQPQLSVYTLTQQREALDINLSGDFDEVDIPVGIRTNISGEIQLDFSGVAGFGHKAYLLDGGQVIDLTANPSYKTTITKTGSSEFYEINDRFVLKFPAAGNDIKSASSLIRIQTESGKIFLRSDDLMETVEILSISGTAIFKSADKARFLTIDATPGQVYIVRITTSKGVKTHKVIAK